MTAAASGALLQPGWRESTRTINGLNLHIVEASDAGDPLLVLLHGFPEFSWAWRHQITPLAQAGYHVVVPDMRGYNTSDAPQEVAAYELDTLAADVIGIADAFGADRFDLVSHDWGTVISWWVAAEYPDRLKHVVLMDGPHPDVWGKQAMKHPTQALKSTYVAFFQLPWVPEATLGSFDFAGLQGHDPGQRAQGRVRTGGARPLCRGMGSPGLADGCAQLLPGAAATPETPGARAAVAAGADPLGGRRPVPGAQRRRGRPRALRPRHARVRRGGKPQALDDLRAGHIKLLTLPDDALAWAFGAHMVEVRVHADTGEVRVPRHVGAFAAGRVLNPSTARSQYLGGMAWGLSSALFEKTEVDARSGVYMNRDLADYLVPTAADIQNQRAIIVPDDDAAVNPEGVKGLGEIGIIGVAAAVANAVFNATGVRVRDLPFRPEALLQEL